MKGQEYQMKIQELLEIVHRSYPDGTTRDYWDEEMQGVTGGFGDQLAEFIVNEIADTYVETNTDEEQLDEALRVMRRACTDIGAVAEALEAYKNENA
jgi:hypothetical protein